MHCPKCGTRLEEVDHSGVRIDRCPGCHGIFLDAGELEQLGREEQAGFLGTLGRWFRD